MMSGALSGVRVIDLSSVIAGPLAVRTLADYGADVVKIESPIGDILRATIPSKHPTMGALHLDINRNKRGLALDLKSPQAKEAMCRLIDRADVLVHNMRPSALKRLGLDYEACRTINPRLIHVGVIGFGRGGRYSERPAYDDLIQAMSGFASLFARGNGGAPRYVPMAMCDRLTGVAAAHAILAALFHRERTGHGQAVEIPMFENLVEFMLGDHMFGHTFDPPLAPIGKESMWSPNRRPYPTKDGEICVLPYVDKHWESFFEVAGLQGTYGKDPRFATRSARAQNAEEALAILAEVLKTRTTAEWLEVLAQADIPCGPVQTLDDLLADPHLKDVNFFSHHQHPSEGGMTIPRPAVFMSETPPSIRSLAPEFGADTREVLRECGYSDQEIEALLASGAAQAGR